MTEPSVVAASSAASVGVEAPPSPEPVILVGDLRTGRIITEVPHSACSVEAVLNSGGGLSVTTHLRDPDVRELDLRFTAAVARAFLAYEYDGAIVEAGPVWTHDYDWSTGRLDIKGAGLWSLWDHRIVLTSTGEAPSGSSLVFTAMTLGTIAKRLVEVATEHTGGSLPIVLPADVAGTADRTYAGFELATVGQRLEQLTSVDGGPDIRFAPRRRADDPRFIEWVMQTGTPAQPALSQAGPDYVVDLPPASGLDGHPVRGLTVAQSGADMAFRAWVQGSGSEQDMLIGSAADSTLVTGSAGYPLLERTFSHSSVTDPATLAAHATGYVARHNRPEQTFRLTVRRDGPVRLSEVRPGDWLRLEYADDPYLGEGKQRLRIVGVSASQGRDVALTLAATTADV